MTHFLNTLPHWTMGVVVVGLTVIPCFLLYWAFHRVLRLKLSDDEVAAGPAFASIIATITSLLLAFTAVSVWDSFKAADDAVTNESNVGAMLARDLASFNSPAATQAREVLRGYLSSVVDVEWPMLADGKENEDSQKRMDDIFRAIGKIEPANKRQEIISGEIWSRINDLARYRRERILAANSQVPDTLWAVVLIGTLLTVVCACTVPPTAFGWSMMGILSVTFGLTFFFIVAMDCPFAGRESVGPEALQRTLDNMVYWDQTELKSQKPGIVKR